MWVDIANLMGPKGADGADGQRGEPGPINIGLNPDEPLRWDQTGGFTFQFVDGSEQTVNLPIASAQSAGLQSRTSAYDSGWRDVRGLLINGWTATTFLIRRTGPLVLFRVKSLVAPAQGPNDAITLPPGFHVSQMGWSLGGIYGPIGMRTNNAGTVNVVMSDHSGGSYAETTGVAPAPLELPSTLPGIAA